LSNQGVGILDFALLRSMIILCFSYLIARYHNVKEIMPSEYMRPIMIRAAAGQGTFLLLSIGIMTVPVTLFIIMLNCTPFFTAILAAIFIKENISGWEYVAMVGSFCGVILIAISAPGGEGEQERLEMLDSTLLASFSA